MSPYAAVWHEDRYYLIGYSKKHDDIANFRIDRMTNVSVSEENKYVCPKDFDLKEYLSSKIKVFKGKKTEVCLKCKSKHMKAILDYFGHEIKTTNAEKGYFNAIIEIELSPWAAKIRLIIQHLLRKQLNRKMHLLHLRRANR